MRRTHRLELRLTDGEHEALVALAGGGPVGPAMLARALGKDGPPAHRVTEAVRAIGAAAAQDVSPGGLLASLERFIESRTGPLRMRALRELSSLRTTLRDL